jgi:hypothetical protein
VKPQQQQKSTDPCHKADAKPAKTAKHTTASDSELGALYSRLNRAQPGSKESKQTADEIIDAIG